MIKAFRGILATNGQETIRLGTVNGLTGYRIIKFQLMPALPGAATYENVVQLWKREQTATSAQIDFSNNALLAAAYLEGSSSPSEIDQLNVIFDNEVFNQDIFITHVDGHASEDVNYYIELEQLKLDQSEAAVATLKDMRGSN